MCKIKYKERNNTNESERESSSHLYDRVSPLQQSNGQQDAFLEDSVTCGVHDEVNDQVRCTLPIQMTLNLRQAYLSSTAC